MDLGPVRVHLQMDPVRAEGTLEAHKCQLVCREAKLHCKLNHLSTRVFFSHALPHVHFLPMCIYIISGNLCLQKDCGLLHFMLFSILLLLVVPFLTDM